MSRPASRRHRTSAKGSYQISAHAATVSSLVSHVQILMSGQAQFYTQISYRCGKKTTAVNSHAESKPVRAWHRYVLTTPGVKLSCPKKKLHVLGITSDLNVDVTRVKHGFSTETGHDNYASLYTAAG